MGNNVISVLQHSQALDLQQALDHVGEHFSYLVSRFEFCKKSLPSFGKDVDEVVTCVILVRPYFLNSCPYSAYVKGMQAAVAGNIEWSLTTPRYFGASDQGVKETSTVELPPLKALPPAAAAV